MSAYLSSGVLTISIDLDAGESPLDASAARSLAAITEALVRITTRYNLPATWAVSDPTGSKIVPRILSQSSRHELALLGNSSWVGSQVPRGQFGRELARRIEQAQSAGWSVTTLALPAAQLGDRGGLAIRHGISAVRHQRLAGSKLVRPLQPRTLQFGLWSFPTAVVFPAASRWLPGGGGVGAARAVIDAAIRSGGLVQLVVDAPRLAARGPSAERIVEHVLRSVDRRRQQGTLEVASIAGVVCRLAGQHQSQPSRSILRPAA